MQNLNSMTTFGEVREALAVALVKVGNGEMSLHDGKIMLDQAEQLRTRITTTLKHHLLQNSEVTC